MTYSEFAEKWLNPAGQRIDYSHNYLYRSPDLIQQYLYECYGINTVYAEPEQWWLNPAAEVLERFFQTAGVDVLPGDILIFINHVGLATGNFNSNDAEIIEQNGATGDNQGLNGDSIRPRYVPRQNLLGALRPQPEIAFNPEVAVNVIPSTPPHGAITAESPLYKPIVKDVPGYMSAKNAATGLHPVTTLSAGKHYFIFTSKYGMDNVTLVSGQPGSWINPADNILEPESAKDISAEQKVEIEESWQEPDWRTTYVPFRNKFGDIEPRYYVAMVDITVIDLETKGSNKLMPQYSVTPIAGTFVKDSVLYGRPKSGADKYLWYGIAMTDPLTGEPNVELESDIYSTVKDTADRQITKTLKPHDYLIIATAKAEKSLETAGKYFDIIKRKRKQ